MNDITGLYDLYEDARTPIFQITITAVATNGDISATFSERQHSRTLYGQYNDPAQQIVFTKHPPSNRAFLPIDYYAGRVVFDANGSPIFMYGLHHSVYSDPSDPRRASYGPVTSWAANFQGKPI
jgi:hypothetical protein